MALSRSRPVGLPAASRSMRPPSGSLVLASTPAALSAAELAHPEWPSTALMNIGRSPVTSSSMAALPSGKAAISQPAPRIQAPSGMSSMLAASIASRTPSLSTTSHRPTSCASWRSRSGGCGNPGSPAAPARRPAGRRRWRRRGRARHPRPSRPRRCARRRVRWRWPPAAPRPWSGCARRAGPRSRLRRRLQPSSKGAQNQRRRGRT